MTSSVLGSISATRASPQSRRSMACRTVSNTSASPGVSWSRLSHSSSMAAARSPTNGKLPDVIRRLDRVIAEAPGRPDLAGADHPMRHVTQQIAFDPGGWTPERSAKVAELFDGLAPGWNQREGIQRREPLVDALDRGGPWSGVAVEVGSGTGLMTD